MLENQLNKTFLTTSPRLKRGWHEMIGIPKDLEDLSVYSKSQIGDIHTRIGKEIAAKKAKSRIG